MTIGDRLLKARTMAQLTQRNIADALGVKSQTVSQWETGKINIGVDHLALLSDLYGVSCDWLIKGEETHPIDPFIHRTIKNKLVEILEVLENDHHL